MQESPIFARTHDLLLWLLQATRKFPREQRFVLARRVQEKAFAFQDAIIAASVDTAHNLEHLKRADILLNGLRKTLLLCLEMGLISPSQHRHVAGMTAEVGKLLGGWQKRIQEQR